VTIATNEALGPLMQAVSDVQQKASKLVKNTDNPFFKSKYATLEQASDMLAPLLVEAGLVVSFAPARDNGAPSLETIIYHLPSSTFLSTEMLLVGATDMQKQGAAITYARRYSLCSIFGLLTEADDDGETAVGRGKATTYRTRPTRTPANTATTISDPTTSPAPASTGADSMTATPSPSVMVTPSTARAPRTRKPTAKQTAVQTRNAEWQALQEGIGAAEAEAAGRPTPQMNNMFWALTRGREGWESPQAKVTEILGRQINSMTQVTYDEMHDVILPLLKVAE
jgi:hypothetical protein